MVSFKALLALTAGATLAAAQSWATWTAPAPAATAGLANSPAGTYNGTSTPKRSYPPAKRTDVDPYAGWCCPWFEEEALFNAPVDASCNGDRNNCFRAFLDARSGSPGAHCPSTAFFDCCYWWTLCENDKAWFVLFGLVEEYAPWTANCGAAPWGSAEEVWDAVHDIDAVCACTIHHEVTVTLPNAYAALNHDFC